jgi:hypothetical protein
MIRKFKRLISSIQAAVSSIHDIRKLLIEIVYHNRLLNSKNKFASSYAMGYFSQSDEDGITIEICKRLRILDKGNFLEIGVGNGTENNTLVLLAHGWKGAWIGCEEVVVNDASVLHYEKAWVTRSNIASLLNNISSSSLNMTKFDLVSIDTDGNDIYFFEKILEIGIQPKVVICEYNGSFPPTVDWRQKYEANHNWKVNNERSFYWGASLLAYKNLLEGHGYFLVACNPQTGVNAFFVHKSYRDLFADAPSDINDIYCKPFYLYANKFGYLKTTQYINSMIRRGR